MENYNAKTKMIIDFPKNGFDSDFILIKDCLLYVGGNDEFHHNELYHNKITLKQSNHLNENHIVYAVQPQDNRLEQAVQNENIYQQQTKRWKQSFLVFKNPKYTTVSTDNIAFFYIRNNAVSMVCFDKQEYTLSQSLDQITAAVSPDQFFRVNRQYLINFKAIKEAELYFMRKLYVRLVIETPEKLLINKEKSPFFLSWMENR
ncbi:LytTr DNA-binding domain-containing protein [Mucilaginibacter gossypiicola]|uniref:LytTr DNA-binding domain-containing protein n=1 Tax=Mucilaginibacter gossypiicola TaxID=551995 RepID=A0A1H8NU61_9SPHI|nr:LytTR family DNA-binding domain-containing protein [Mucilaginibacter gossypiicola]SEO33134.1 LytTr DNA-binding domain-containing protein [Mucilaginibacter gossypiicola]